MARSVFDFETSGSYTVADAYAGAGSQDLAGAATAGATAEAGINEFVIDGGGLLPPSVLMGAAIGRATASGSLDVLSVPAAPRFSKAWALRVTPAGELVREAA